MIYSVGVDISIAFQKDVYYFRYKGVNFKYVPHYKNNETDDLVCQVPNDSSQPKMYELMTEFFSAFAFANNAKVIVHSGIASPIDAKLNKVNIRFSVKRSIHPYGRMNEFYKISLLNTPEQIQLARLYREGFSSNNIYLKILFLWHCLVYPKMDEEEAVTYINNLVENLPQELECTRDDIDRVNRNKIFMNDKSTGKGSMGEYIKDSIRHSIAHIVRRPGYGIDLRLDSWDQMRHLGDVGYFMQNIVRYRLENEFAMKASNDVAIFRYISEDEL